jgi:chemotaxis protein CheZ
MSQTQAKIGNALLTSLVELKQKNNGELNIEDVGALFQGIASSLPAEGNELDTILQREIVKIADYIAKAKQEISSMSPAVADGQKNIGQAGIELDEVIQATEKAANEIMDAAEIIMSHAGSIKDAAASKAVNAAVENIFNACNFQDLTSQRIRKVIKTLEFLDYKVNRILEFVNGSVTSMDMTPEEEARFVDKRPDADLCNGPQAAGVAPSQSDIDDLFNKS